MKSITCVYIMLAFVWLGAWMLHQGSIPMAIAGFVSALAFMVLAIAKSTE